jgi:hypothetical protein
MKKLNKRKGQAHIEMIISFSIFIGFLLFMIIMFRPFEPKLDIKIVDSVFTRFDEAYSVEVYSVSARFLPDLLGNFPDEVGFDSITIKDSMRCTRDNLIVKNKNGDNLDKDHYGIEGSGSSVFLKLNDPSSIPTSENYFYTFSCSKVFSEVGTLTSCSSCTTINANSDIEFGSMYVKRAWAVKYLEEGDSSSLKAVCDDGYTTNYPQLRSAYVPLGNSFGLNIIGLDGLAICEALPSKIPASNVYTKSFPIEVVYDDGKIERAIVQIYIW